MVMTAMMPIAMYICICAESRFIADILRYGTNVLGGAGSPVAGLL
jgi:hypothetical protein